VSAPAVDPARLRAFLRADELPTIRRIGQGQSNLTFLVEADGRRIVLRRPPEGPLPPSAHDVLREHRVISALHGGPVPVPRPIAACDDRSVLGAPFYLMEAVEGDAIRFELPAGLAGQERAIGWQVVDALARLHAIEPGAVGLADLGRPSGYLERQLRRWTGQLDHARVRATPDLDRVGDWLRAHLPPEGGPVAIVHGDYKLDNLLFGPGAPAHLAAVVDWEMATLGDPLADLGWLLAFWREPGEEPLGIPILPRVTEAGRFPSRAELAERYGSSIGRPRPDLAFYLALAAWKLAILLEGHWARHVRGTAAGFEFGYLERGGPILWEWARSLTDQDGLA
jgi:aminoglycoside phosphotransferase (APT) family kinase protein